MHTLQATELYDNVADLPGQAVRKYYLCAQFHIGTAVASVCVISLYEHNELQIKILSNCTHHTNLICSKAKNFWD